MSAERDEPAAARAQCYLAYLTANDSRSYVADWNNFRRMASVDPGVPSIALYLAISGVRPFDDADRASIARLLSLADECPWLEVRAVLWKGNVGRDFSSAEACLQEIGCSARPQDWVMVRNRSAYGPYGTGWYGRYQAQYERWPRTGLVGSTINLCGHPGRQISPPWVHVQTYAYLSQWRHLRPLAEAYPGARATERLEVIAEGEVGLSSRMLQRGLGLSCLYWPDEFFTAERDTAPHLPQGDVKEAAHTVPLRYRFRSYFFDRRQLPGQVLWLCRQKIGANVVGQHSEPRQITLARYGTP